jgi:hypothetical protein
VAVRAMAHNRTAPGFSLRVEAVDHRLDYLRHWRNPSFRYLSTSREGDDGRRDRAR